MIEVTPTLSSPKLLGVRFYVSARMVCHPLHVVYACVCGVMSVRVRESVMHVGEGGVHK